MSFRRKGRRADAGIDETDAVFAAAAREAFPRLVRYAATIVSSAQAEDAAQEALTKAWRYLHTFDGRGSFEGWLFRICRRCALDLVARDAARPVELHGLAPPPPADPLLGPDSSVALGMLVAALPEPQREPFALTQLAGLTYEEAAEVLEVPVGTVRSRVSRARAVLVERVSAAEAS